MEYGINITLTVHEEDAEKVLELLQIADEDGEFNHPIDAFCLEIVERLKEWAWQGSIILNYFPWHWYRVKEDLKILKEFLDEGKTPEISPINNQYREKKECWYF